MASNWTPEEISILQTNLHLSTSDIAAVYAGTIGVQARSYDSIQKKVKALRSIFSPDSTNDPLPISATTSDEDLLLSHQIENLFVPSGQIEHKVNQWINDIATHYSGRKSTPVDSNGKSLVIGLSDNHFGKKTGTFNLEIARSRVLSMTQEILNNTPNIDDVDEVIVVLAGDEVEGEDIYASQNGGLECPVIYQARAACEAYWAHALDLRATFQCKVRIVCCPGNHGRMSKTADERSNWDNVVYMMLAILAEQNPELDIHVDLNFENFAMFEVKGKKGLAYHYGTKHLGTPAMQIKMAGWIVAKNIDFIIHGHWHHWGVESWMGRPMMHNGCLCGPDDLAEKMAVEEPPRQGYFFVEKDKPIRTFSFVEW